MCVYSGISFGLISVTEFGKAWDGPVAPRRGAILGKETNKKKLKTVLNLETNISNFKTSPSFQAIVKLSFLTACQVTADFISGFMLRNVWLSPWGWWLALNPSIHIQQLRLVPAPAWCEVHCWHPHSHSPPPTPGSNFHSRCPAGDCSWPAMKECHTTLTNTGLIPRFHSSGLWNPKTIAPKKILPGKVQMWVLCSDQLPNPWRRRTWTWAKALKVCRLRRNVFEFKIETFGSPQFQDCKA